MPDLINVVEEGQYISAKLKGSLKDRYIERINREKLKSASVIMELITMWLDGEVQLKKEKQADKLNKFKNSLFSWFKK